ncbi:MAG TPA: hypothetical protein DCX01_08185, partial [Bacteroidetes bacterium]|nr:hypothetical protein [Bacteroidota bacterium]
KEFVKAKLLPPPPPEDDVEDLDDNEPPTNDDIIEVKTVKASVEESSDAKVIIEVPTETTIQSRPPIAKKVIAKKEKEPESDQNEIPNEAAPKLPSSDKKKEDKDSFTSGDQISLL